MFLAIDVGNTSTTAAVHDGTSFVVEGRFATKRTATADYVNKELKRLLKSGSIDPKMIRSAGVSNVVPPVSKAFRTAIRAIFKVDAVFIDGSTDLGIKNRTLEPLAVGADRLCNAVAGFAKYGGPLIIVDYGTATTYDVVAANGDYLGGVIAPGVETSASALHSKTAQLPKITLELPKDFIGRDTVSSMQLGVLYGAIDATEGMVDRLKIVLERTEGATPKVIGTGGFSAFMSLHSKVLDHVEPRLVLEGIRVICGWLKG